MKKLNFKTVFTALLLVVCLSCTDKENGITDITDDNNVSSTDTFLTAKVDDVDFEVIGGLFLVTTNIGGINASNMTASYDNDSKSINIGLSNIKSTGTYTPINLATDDPLTSSYISSLFYGEGDGLWLNGGVIAPTDINSRVTITEFNSSYIAGTFQFTGHGVSDMGEQTEKNITEGNFRFKRI